MDSRKAKQRVTLALDTCGMRGRFTVRDVGETAMREISYGDLSQTDQRSCLLAFVMSEAKAQMKAPLRSDFKEEHFKKLPSEYWPIIENLTRTICVGAGRDAYHVFTMYAQPEDWEAFFELGAVMEKRAKTVKNSAREIYNLLTIKRVGTLSELLTGIPAETVALKGN